MSRLSIPGYLCTHCGAVMGDSIVCPGCKWADPLTRRPADAATPTAREPWTVRLCWTPEQNHGVVSVHGPSRAPITAVAALIRAGEPAEDVAAEFDLLVEEVQVLEHLIADLSREGES